MTQDSHEPSRQKGGTHDSALLLVRVQLGASTTTAANNRLGEQQVGANAGLFLPLLVLGPSGTIGARVGAKAAGETTGSGAEFAPCN